ncbi:MAG: hypothetical protein ABS43_03610 [Bordetella sp. SCN 67-23]|nr:hypothetical protein [Burkholderiales bacterium]ODS75889.1 MAG: hypothetical protein ABS43_03610 [Bordetella sp. SCN 67-23]OJW91765.1 MAG: hypothetical protein BGO71_21640 [Burkholderiales bacterium 67-32]
MSTPATAQPIEIFRAGRHTSVDGRTFDFTPEQLRAACAAYNPALHEAPHVIGHPDSTAPAYGWVAELRFNEATNAVEAISKQVEPQFAELVQAGRFKKRSPTWYLAGDPNNPKPGTLYLRDVGWLGAHPPAVKGLQDVSFAEHDQAVSFAEPIVAGVLTGLFRRFREWMIANGGGLVEADRVIPEYVLDDLEREVRPSPEQTPVPFSEPKNPTKEEDMSKELQDQLEAANRKNAEWEAKFAESQKREKEQRHAAHVAFAEGQVKAAKLPPNAKDGLVAVLDTLAGAAEAQPIQFSEGGKTETLAPATWLMNLFGQAKPLVQFGEFKGGADPTAASSQVASDADFDRLVGEHMAAHKVSYAEAMNAVSARFSV